MYVAVKRAEYRAPVRIMVLTLSRAVARWAARPIVLDDGASVVVPKVIGPQRIPEVTDVERAKALPELGVVSTMAHGRGRQGESIARAALAGVRGLDRETRELSTDVIVGSLPAALARSWRKR